MNTISQKSVGYNEALDAAKALRWRMGHLEEHGVTGAVFLAEIEEELAQAENLLNRKFTAKAKQHGLDEMLKSRVAKARHFAFDSQANTQTIH